MGYSSQTGQVGFGIQADKGTAVPATRFTRLRSGSLGPDRDLIVPEPEIGGNRDISGGYLGPVGFSGDLEMYVRMTSAALLLKGVLGSSSSGSVAGTNEVQTIATTGVPTGGTFQLRFRGQTTTSLDFDATDAEVDAALEALDAIAAGEVTSVGGPLPTGIAVTFSGQYATENVPTIQVVNQALTGGTDPEVTVTDTTPGVATIGTHVLTPSDTLPWFTIEERISNQLESFQYRDGKVNSFRLEADATGLLMATANIAAIRQVADFTEQVAPDWDLSPMVVGSQIVVTVNGTELPGKSFNCEITNQIETDDFVMGSIYAQDMTEKRREARLGLTYRPQDADLWKAAMYGAELVNEPGAGPAYQAEVTVHIETFETIGDVVGGTPFAMDIEIPEAIFTPFKITPSGDDVLQSDIELTAVRSDPVIPLMTVTVTNDLVDVS